MTPQEAKRILHPETTLEAYAETDYYGGFNGAKKWKAAVDEACLVACEALEKQVPKKPIMTNWINCPSCNWGLTLIKGTRYCPKCGQKLSWESDTE